MQAMMVASGLYLGAFSAMDTSTRDLLRWFGLLVATPVVFYSARPFFTGALRSLRARRLGMDVPVSIAIALIYAASLVEAVRGGREVYFDSVSMFVFFFCSAATSNCARATVPAISPTPSRGSRPRSPNASAPTAHANASVRRNSLPVTVCMLRKAHRFPPMARSPANAAASTKRCSPASPCLSRKARRRARRRQRAR
jgi:hypothetical protein